MDFYRIDLYNHTISKGEGIKPPYNLYSIIFVDSLDRAYELLLDSTNREIKNLQNDILKLQKIAEEINEKRLV